MSLTIKEIEEKVSKDNPVVLFSFIALAGILLSLVWGFISYSSVTKELTQKIESLQIENRTLVQNNENLSKELNAFKVEYPHQQSKFTQEMNSMYREYLKEYQAHVAKYLERVKKSLEEALGEASNASNGIVSEN